MLVTAVLLNGCSSSGQMNMSGTGGSTAGTGGQTTGTAGGGAAGGGNATGTGGSTAGTGGGGAGTGGGAGGCTFGGGEVSKALFPGGVTLQKACSPYHIKDGIQVQNDGVLTIEAGVTVMFGNSTPLDVGGTGAGKLLVNGTAQDPVTLTHDDPNPIAGGWFGIEFFAGTVSGSTVSFTKVDYAGGNCNGAIVDVPGLAGVITIDHVTIDHVGSANGISGFSDKGPFTITNSTINGVPAANYAIAIVAPSFSSIGAGNTFATGSVIAITGGTVATNTSWTNPGAPIVVTDDNVAVDGANTPVLTLAAGMSFKFDDGFGLHVGEAMGGKLVVAGTTASHVTFTSNDMAPTAGAWDGVEIFGSGKAQLS